MWSLFVIFDEFSVFNKEEGLDSKVNNMTKAAKAIGFGIVFDLMAP